MDFSRSLGRPSLSAPVPCCSLSFVYFCIYFLPSACKFCSRSLVAACLRGWPLARSSGSLAHSAVFVWPSCLSSCSVRLLAIELGCPLARSLARWKASGRPERRRSQRSLWVSDFGLRFGRTSWLNGVLCGPLSVSGDGVCVGRGAALQCVQFG